MRFHAECVRLTWLLQQTRSIITWSRRMLAPTSNRNIIATTKTPRSTLFFGDVFLALVAGLNKTPSKHTIIKHSNIKKKNIITIELEMVKEQNKGLIARLINILTEQTKDPNTTKKEKYGLNEAVKALIRVDATLSGLTETVPSTK